MNKNDIKLLYEYNRWANGRMLEATAPLAPGLFIKDASNSHHGVQNMLTHILAGEWIWLKRWQGLSPKAMFRLADFASYDVFLKKWTEVEHEQTNFIKGLTDEALKSIITYVNTDGETWEYQLVHMMQHLVNHSSYHRGQVMAMLRQLGVEPVPTDFLVYLDMKSSQDGENLPVTPGS